MVKNLFFLLTSRQNSILSGAAVLMATVGLSRILGLVRDRLLAHNFSPDQTAIFFASFRIPDLLFQLLIFGAVSVAFIPTFTDYLQKKGEDEAFKFATDVFNVVLIAFSLMCLLAFIFVTPLTEFVVPGFSPEQKATTASLTQIILLGQILLAIGSFFAGILQSYQRFIIPALSAVFYNLGIIFGIVALTPAFGLLGPAVGVVIGASMHALLQVPLVTQLGFRYKLSFNVLNEGIREVISLMSIRTIGVAVEQINETVGIILASLITSSSVTFLTFAQHLHTVPIGLFGATLAQAALPVLARERSRGEDGLFKGTLLTTMHQILFLTLPAAAILIVLRIPAVRLVFGASQFDWDATVLTGRTLAFLAVGLVAQSVILLLVRGFYALKDTKTPVLVSIVSVLANIGLSFYFIRVLKLDVWGLGLSYAIVTNLSAILLFFFLARRVGGFTFQDVFYPAGKMFVAAIIAAITLYLPMKALDQLVFDTTRTINLMFLTGIASLAGLSIYILLVWVMQVKELQTFVNLVKRILSLKFAVESKEIVQ